MRMDRLILDSGKIMKNMVKENIVGRMEIDMMENIDVEKDKVLGSCITLMDKNMKEIGWMEWNKVKESIKALEIL